MTKNDLIGGCAPRTALAVACATLLAFTSPGQAQRAQAAGGAAETVAALGVYGPGWADFTRYRVPGMCVLAARGAGGRAWRTVAAQRAARRLPLDTTPELPPPPVVAAVARACGQRFLRADAAALANLPDIFDLALLAQDAAAAVAALERRVASAAPGERAALLGDAVDRYLAAAPARVTAAEALLPRLEALGDAGHRQLVGALVTLLQFRGRRGDFAGAGATAERLLTVTRTLPPPVLARAESAVVLAHKARLVRAWAAAPDSAAATAATVALAAAMRSELAALPPIPDEPGLLPPTGDSLAYAKLGALEPTALAAALVPALMGGPLAGRAAPPLEAEAWAPATHLPVPPPVGVMLYHGLGAFDYVGDPIVEDMRRWHARFGDVLQLTVRVWTGPRDHLSTPVYGENGALLTPAEEMARARWYFQDYLKLPVQLAFVTRLPEDYWLVQPAPSGRRQERELYDIRYWSRARTAAESLYIGDAPDAARVPNRLLLRDGRVVTRAGEDGAPFLAGWPLFELRLRRMLGEARMAAPARDTRPVPPTQAGHP